MDPPKKGKSEQKRRRVVLFGDFAFFQFPIASDRLRSPQEGPKRPQEGPKKPQEGPKKAPRGPRRAPKGPKRGPRGAQDGPKTAPRRIFNEV